MADLEFPQGLRPFRMMHYLQPHVGGSESPLTRTRKVYGLSKPRWISRISFRGLSCEYDGVRAADIPPQLDSLIIRMAGGLNRIALWDFRRPYPVGLRRYYRRYLGQRYSFTGGETFNLGERFFIPQDAEPVNEEAQRGATSITFIGFEAGEPVFRIGDYFGGDGRMHMIHNHGIAGSDGRVTVSFDPPLEADIGRGRAITMQPTAMFRLDGEDAGQNEETVGEATVYTLSFTEDLP